MNPAGGWLTHRTICWDKAALFCTEGAPCHRHAVYVSLHKLLLLPQHFNLQSQASGEGSSPPGCAACHLLLPYQVLSNPSMEGETKK